MKHYFQTKLDNGQTIIDFGKEATGTKWYTDDSYTTTEVAGMVLLPSGILPYWKGEKALSEVPQSEIDRFLVFAPEPVLANTFEFGTPEYNKADQNWKCWYELKQYFAEEFLYKSSICGGFTYRRIRSGRLMCEVQTGNTHRISMRLGIGDRTWDNWENQRPEDPDAFGIARHETNGGGAWVELLILPLDGKYKTAQQALYESELA
jgi:hypothetical protein